MGSEGRSPFAGDSELRRAARRRNAIIATVIVVIFVLPLLLQCAPKKPVAPADNAEPPAVGNAPAPSAAQEFAPAPAAPAEILTAETVEAPAEIGAGAPFEVSWTGPAKERDCITIVQAGTAERSLAENTNASRGLPLTVKAHPTAGNAGIRYVSGQSNRTLARRAIRVTQWRRPAP